MKKRIFLYMIIISSMGLSAQKNYADFLVQGAFTYWSLTKSVCHPQWNMIEKGLCIGKDSLFDWYRITDENDTLSLGDGMDWNFYADHRSFELNKDTLFVIQWDINDSGFQEPCDLIPDTVQAYKILYITKQKLLLLSLVKDSLSQWVEYRNLKCNELIILEFDCSGVMDGELWMSRKRIPCNERFEFSGKERDEETGYDYFGTRNYTSAASIWLSPDPLSDKYPQISSYAYCAWNPMRYVDPDGRRIIVGSWFGRAFAKLGFNNYEAKVQSHLLELKDMDPELNKMIADLENSSIDFHIKHDNNSNHYNPGTKVIEYDPDNYIRKNGAERPPEAALAHELGHAENDMNGTSVTYNEDMADGKIGTPAKQAIEQEKQNRNEVNSIYYENIVREKKSILKGGMIYSIDEIIVIGNK